MSSNRKKPFVLYVLVLFLFILATSAMYGGFSLILDTSGGILGMEESILTSSPFRSYQVPGIILLVILGILPLFLIYPLLTRPHWKWARKLNIYKNQHWAWTYSLYVGLGVIIWIDVQIYLIGYSQFIQTFIAALGVLIVIFTLWPSVMKYYRRTRVKKSGTSDEEDERP